MDKKKNWRGGCARINLLKLIQESRDKEKSGSVGGHKPMDDKIYGHVLFMRYTNAIEFIYLVTFNKKTGGRAFTRRPHYHQLNREGWPTTTT